MRLPPAKRDVFLCHASADKDAYVRPFAAALESNGVSYWLDEAEIGWGDRISSRINAGLDCSSYVVVFLTNAFLQRHWPQTELGSALNFEASTGQVFVLPIMAAAETDVFKQYPLLRDKNYLRWQDGLESIVSALISRLGIEFKTKWSYSHPASYSGQVWIQIIPKTANAAMPTDCKIRWGPWVYSKTLNFGVSKSVTLLHEKGNDGLSFPIFLEVSVPCHVVFGQGDATDGDNLDINRGWVRLS